MALRKKRMGRGMRSRAVDKGHKKKKASLTDIKPVDYGPGTDRMSEEIDKYIYGEKLAARTSKRLQRE